MHLALSIRTFESFTPEGWGARLCMRMDYGLVYDLKGTTGSAEVLSAVVCVWPHLEGSMVEESVWKLLVFLSVGVYCPESLLWQWAVEDCLFHSEVFPVCVVGAQQGNVLIVSIKQHFFNLHDRPLKTHDTWGKSSKDEEEERKEDNYFHHSCLIWKI